LHLSDLFLCALSGRSNGVFGAECCRVSVRCDIYYSQREAWRVVTVVHHTGSTASASITSVSQPELPLPFQLHSHNHSLDRFSWLRQCADIDSELNRVVTT